MQAGTDRNKKRASAQIYVQSGETGQKGKV